MSKPMEHIRYLVDIIGFRAPTSEGESWASKYIKEVMDKLGIENQVEGFESHRTFSYPYMIILGIILFGSLISCSHGFLGFLIAGFGAVSFYLENTCRGWAARLVPHDPSQNVVGRIRAKGEMRRRVVLTAHYDTSRSGISFHPRFVGGFRTSFLVTMFSVFGIPLLIVLRGLFWSGLFGFLQDLATIWLAVGFLLLLHREVYGKNVYGANDNASGTGVMLSVAEKIAASPLENTEVWVVATGCEEAGMVGMLHFLTRHELEVQDALIVNLDNLGAGELKYVTGEGLITAFPSDPELLMLSAEVVRENSDLSLAPHEYRTLPTDAFAALVKGGRAMSVMAFDEEGVIPNWHWETDVIGNLDEKNLDDAELFLERLLKKIDSEK